MGKKDKKPESKNKGKSRRKDTGRTDKFSDENPLKDFQDFRDEYDGKRIARKEKEKGEFQNMDTNNLHILTSRLKAMENIDPAHRKQPDWDFKHEGLLQRVHGLTKSSKTVK